MVALTLLAGEGARGGLQCGFGFGGDRGTLRL